METKIFSNEKANTLIDFIHETEKTEREIFILFKTGKIDQWTYTDEMQKSDAAFKEFLSKFNKKEIPNLKN
ncbi:MAG: hypothetical protein WCJ45_03820 [bacterium]